MESQTRIKRRAADISRQPYEQEKPDAPCEQPFSTSSGHAHASRHEQLPVLTIEEEAEHTIVEEAAHQGHRFHNQRNAQSGQYNGCGGLDWCVVLYVVWCGVMSCDALSCPVVPNIVLPCHVSHSRTENEMRIGRRQNVKPTCEKARPEMSVPMRKDVHRFWTFANGLRLGAEGFVLAE